LSNTIDTGFGVREVWADGPCRAQPPCASAEISVPRLALPSRRGGSPTSTSPSPAPSAEKRAEPDACKELSVTGQWRGSCSGRYPDKGHRGRSGRVGAGRERSAQHCVIRDLWPRLAGGGVGDGCAGLPCRAEADSMSLDKREKIGYRSRRPVQEPGSRSQKTEEWLQGEMVNGEL
jgi:hypothetical protein